MNNLTFGYSRGPANSVEVIPHTESWEQLSARLASPMIGAKDGDYISCGPFNNNYRNGANLEGQTGSFFVIDADSKMDPETGEVFSSDKGAPAPELVHDALKDKNIPHIIFSTHSNVVKGHRYRILIPVQWDMTKDSLAAMYHWTLSILHNAGVGVAVTSESLRPAQLWYLPRVPDQQTLDRYYFVEYDGGQPFPLNQVSSWWLDHKSNYDVTPELHSTAFNDETAIDINTPIGRYNTKHSIEWMSRKLIDVGYTFIQQSTSNGEASYRYLNPDSSSGSAGTVLFKTVAGVWRVYSHNDSDEELGDGYAHDAFDLFTIFDKEGDKRAALEGIGLLQVYILEELQQLIEDADPTDTNTRMLIIKRLAGSKLSEMESDDIMKQVSTKFKTSITAIRNEEKSNRKNAAKAAAVAEIPPMGIDLAHECIQWYGEGNVLFSEGMLWLWEAKGVWSNYPAEYLDKILIQNPLKAMYPKWSYESKHINDVRNLMKGACSIPGNMQPKQSEHHINCLNGELMWSVEQERWEMFLHNRDNLSTNQCNFNSTGTWVCDRWDSFMWEVFANSGTDQDIWEQIQLLQAMIGYSMTTSTKLEKFVYLWGPGGNGKSVITNVIKGILGDKNVSAVQPSEFSNNFHIAHMDKKAANIVTEVQEGELIDAAKTKAISSGESVTIAHKFGHPFEAVLFATLWYVANHVAKTKDHSDAFFQRALLFHLPNQFRDTEKQEFDLTEELLKEKDGIAMRCLISYGEVLKSVSKKGTRGLVIPKVIRRNVDEWKHENDPVRNFVEDCIKVHAKGVATHADVYRRYTAWCQENGSRWPVQQRTLTNRITSLFALEKRARGTGNVAVLRGIEVCNWDGTFNAEVAPPPTAMPMPMPRPPVPTPPLTQMPMPTQNQAVCAPPSWKTETQSPQQ